MTDLNPGAMVRLRSTREVRVVGSEEMVVLPAGWIAGIVDHVPEAHQLLIDATGAGPSVWIDIGDVDAAST